MSRFRLIVTFALGLLLAPLAADAQQAAKVPRVGFLTLGSPPSPYFEALREGLRGLGYVEGRTITIEPRFAEGKVEKLADHATELVRLKVNVILAVGGASVQAAKNATSTIPIVMGFSGDPVEARFVVSLARPGGNITGLSFLSSELAGKRLELLKEVTPGISRVAVLSNPDHPGEQFDWRQAQAAARVLAMALQYVVVRGPKDFDNAFATMSRERVNAILVFPDALTLSHRKQIAEFAVKAQVPMISGWREFTDAAGLMSYGPSLRDGLRRAATYVDKILKGAKPADLPVEQPTRFELVINMKTAKALGLTIPQSMFIRADEVIQ